MGPSAVECGHARGLSSSHPFGYGLVWVAGVVLVQKGLDSLVITMLLHPRGQVVLVVCRPRVNLDGLRDVPNHLLAALAEQNAADKRQFEAEVAAVEAEKAAVEAEKALADDRIAAVEAERDAGRQQYEAKVAAVEAEKAAVEAERDAGRQQLEAKVAELQAQLAARE